MVVHRTRRELVIAVPGKNRILKADADSTRLESGQWLNSQKPHGKNICISFNGFIAILWKQRPGMNVSIDNYVFVVDNTNALPNAGPDRSWHMRLQPVHSCIRFLPNSRLSEFMAFAPNSGELYFVDDETNTLNSIRFVCWRVVTNNIHQVRIRSRKNRTSLAQEVKEVNHGDEILLSRYTDDGDVRRR